jgi:hypothetical protein
MLGSRFMVVIVIIIIVVPLFCFWSVYPMQGCDDILAQTFCRNLFGGSLSLNIQNAIIRVWSFITMVIYKNNCRWTIGFFLQVIWRVDES